MLAELAVVIAAAVGGVEVPEPPVVVPRAVQEEPAEWSEPVGIEENPEELYELEEQEIEGPTFDSTEGEPITKAEEEQIESES